MGGGRGGGGGGGVNVSKALADRDAEWQEELRKRDEQWNQRIGSERTAAQQQLLQSQQDAAYKKKLNKPAGKLDSTGGAVPGIATSAQGLGDSATVKKVDVLGA